MGSAFNLGKLFGIQFRLHYTWFIVFILVVVSLSVQYFPGQFTSENPVVYWVIGVIASLLLFASVIAHELSHSLAARANGIPVSSITLFIFGGVSQITREARKANTELIIAAAGPVCSLALAGLFWLLYLYTDGVIEPVAAIALWLASVNGVLAVFNLIPGFPLDGGRVFRALLWRFSGRYYRSTRIATQVGRVVGYLFIVGGIISMFFLNWFTGLWLAFIGWFLENAASASYRQAQWREGLAGYTATQVMSTDYVIVSPEVTVADVVQGYLFASGHRFFVVAEEGELRGILTLQDIRSVPQENWSAMRVREAMTPVDRLRMASPDQEVLGILENMVENNVNQIPVVREGKVIGLITRDQLLRLLPARSNPVG